MAAVKCEITRCGLCRFYSHEGRRGGQCNQLDVTVDSHWKACCLAASPFSTKLESLPGIAKWGNALPQAAPVVTTLEVSAPAAALSATVAQASL